jgi:hypothetical protein
MSKISPCLWFDGEAEEAAKFYVSLLPDSKIENVQKNTVDLLADRADCARAISGRTRSRRRAAGDGRDAADGQARYRRVEARL